jgi:hypothetical protein
MQKLLNEWRDYLASEKLIITERVSKPDGETKTLAIPKIALSEKWGMPGSEDRKLIDQFMARIPGNTLAEKIEGVEAFISECTDEACIEKKNIPEILSNLVFLDSLASVLFDFNAQVAGILFESFLAALLRGTQVAGTQQIEDILDAEGAAVSLKFIATKTPVGGSFFNLIKAIKKYGSVKYIVCYKVPSGTEMKLYFFSFTIGFENADFMLVRQHPENKYFDYGDYAHPSYKAATKDGDKWGQLGDKWKMSFDEIDNNNYFLGALNIGSRESITEVANRYVSHLGDSLVNIFNLLNSLTKNVNTYFLEDNKAAGLAAKENADNLAINVRETIL